MADSNGNGSSNGKNVGTVESVAGVVVDVLFPEQLPEIYSALEIQLRAQDAEASTLVC